MLFFSGKHEGGDAVDEESLLLSCWSDRLENVRKEARRAMVEEEGMVAVANR